MTRPDVNRQLLLGMLAFQNGFVDRTALLTAFDAWSQAKSQSLGELFVANGALTADKLTLLEALVEHHLQRFDGDVMQSLTKAAALDTLIRDDLEQIASPDVQQSLAQVRRGAAAEPTLLPAVGESTSAGTRFRILRPHARGGLGEVFVAEDAELHREVALKQIQVRHADDADSRARFLLEAEITGSLEHPSIVPVYGLGAYADGRPFYAMRFIRGDSLQEAAERYHKPQREITAGDRGLEFRKMLQRFIDVCNAIDYAHSRGVLHRDLKPGNVMLGKYGETLVVDWGLAKAVGKDSPADPKPRGERVLKPLSGNEATPTQYGSAVGTPGYMSPEQAAGLLDTLGPPSDIFGLGATLYHLLVGRPPFSGNDLGEVLRKVQRGDFPAPRQLKPEVPLPLQAICLKAMSIKPADRYPTARALADDVEHWLADEPVTARVETVVDRARRWGRKHRGLVAAGILGLIAVAAVSIVAVININASRRDEQIARELAERNAHEAEAQRNRAEEGARIADEQRNLTLDTLNALVFDIQDQLGNRPGLNDLKQKILETARGNLTKLGDMSGGASRNAGRLSAMALLKTGDILTLLGSLPEAQQRYHEARDILSKLADEAPRNTLAHFDLSVAYSKLADGKLRQGDLAEARNLYEQTLAIRRRLVETNPEDTGVRRNLSMTFDRLADISLIEGKSDVAQKLYEQELEISLNLATADPKDREIQRDVSIGYERLGRLAIERNDIAGAKKFYEEGCDIARKLAADAPTDTRFQRDLAVSLKNLGDVAAKQNDFTTARQLFEQSLAIRRQLAKDEPADTEAQRDLTVALDRLGGLSFEQADLKTAGELYRQALDISQKLADAAPSDVQAQRDLSVWHERLADVAMKEGNGPEARRRYEQVLGICQRLANAAPGDASAQRNLAIAHYKLGNLAEGEGNLSAAKQSYATAVGILDRLIGAGSLVDQLTPMHNIMKQALARVDKAPPPQTPPTRAPTHVPPED